MSSYLLEPVPTAAEGAPLLRLRAGSAMIQQTLGTTTIQQLTDKAIIDWQRFGIDANELVRFVQPSEMAVSLNRVTGSDPSVILGKLQANGQVFLVNPNGWVEPGIALATSFDSAALYCCFR